MRLISWQRLGIIASVVWVVVGPSYFHLSRGAWGGAAATGGILEKTEEAGREMGTPA